MGLRVQRCKCLDHRGILIDVSLRDQLTQLMQSKSYPSKYTRATRLTHFLQTILGRFETGIELTRQIALYVAPVAWTALFIVSLLKFNISYAPHPRVVASRSLKSSFLPIIFLAMVFNLSNLAGF